MSAARRKSNFYSTPVILIVIYGGLILLFDFLAPRRTKSNPVPPRPELKVPREMRKPGSHERVLPQAVARWIGLERSNDAVSAVNKRYSRQHGAPMARSERGFDQT